jgi:MULE transposase domain
MFTVHGLFRSQIIPLVYGLLVGKSAADYDHFFQRIMEEDDFNPESILSDFEAATIKSINSLFPNTLHKGGVEKLLNHNHIVIS